jgi:phosphatidylserine decarboxylase
VFAPGAGRWLFATWAAVAAFGFVAALAWEGSTSAFGPAWAWSVAAAGVAGLAAFLSIFFRDPERRIGTGIVSAADGRVREVGQEGGRWLVSVFMNVTDVHVNRAPYDGTVEQMDNAGHGFRPAYSSGARSNVQRRYRLSTPLGPIEVVQITGAVARRLVSWVSVGATLAKGDRFGMIAFGSRVDVFFSAASAEPCVAVGDPVRAGTTSIARERV